MTGVTVATYHLGLGRFDVLLGCFAVFAGACEADFVCGFWVGCVLAGCVGAGAGSGSGGVVGGAAA